MKDPTSEILLKRCRTCNTNLPISSFGLCRTNSDGYSNACKECRSQRSRLRRVRKYGSTPMKEDPCIRSIHTQNKFVLTYGFNQPKYEAVAFNTMKRMDYKVYFGPSEKSGLKSICFFNLDGSVMREIAFSGGDQLQVVEGILAFLRLENIRLELTDVHAFNAKTLLYPMLYTGK